MMTHCTAHFVGWTRQSGRWYRNLSHQEDISRWEHLQTVNLKKTKKNEGEREFFRDNLVSCLAFGPSQSMLYSMLLYTSCVQLNQHHSTRIMAVVLSRNFIFTVYKSPRQYYSIINLLFIGLWNLLYLAKNCRRLLIAKWAKDNFHTTCL